MAALRLVGLVVVVVVVLVVLVRLALFLVHATQASAVMWLALGVGVLWALCSAAARSVGRGQ